MSATTAFGLRTTRCELHGFRLEAVSPELKRNAVVKGISRINGPKQSSKSEP